MYCLINLSFFDIPLLYYYINYNLSIGSCIFSEDIYLSFEISISLLASPFCECNSLEDFFERFVILSVTLLPIKSPVASDDF